MIPLLMQAEITGDVRRRILPKNKTLFIVNPHAALGSAGREWPRIKSLARDRLGHFRTLLTTAPGDATRFARQALVDGTELIVCVGGDGTLNEIVNGYMGEDAPVRPEARLGLIPLGTGCDLIKSIPIPKEPGRALDLIADSHSRPIDLGRLRYTDHNGRSAYRYFVNITSFGLGGEVVDRVNRNTKVFGGFISFIWGTLASILSYNKKQTRLRVDNVFDEDVITWSIIVANGQYQGGGMQVAPEARVDDGLFHVTIVGNLSMAEVFRNLHKLYTGKVLEIKKVASLTGKRVEAYSDQRVLLDVDGEQPGRLPVTIEIVPGALSFITSNEFF